MIKYKNNSGKELVADGTQDYLQEIYEFLENPPKVVSI
jgi:hypothetical protein